MTSVSLAFLIYWHAAKINVSDKVVCFSHNAIEKNKGKYMEWLQGSKLAGKTKKQCEWLWALIIIPSLGLKVGGNILFFVYVSSAMA
jgi:hypothetical protein